MSNLRKEYPTFGQNIIGLQHEDSFKSPKYCRIEKEKNQTKIISKNNLGENMNIVSQGSLQKNDSPGFLREIENLLNNFNAQNQKQFQSLREEMNEMNVKIDGMKKEMDDRFDFMEKSMNDKIRGVKKAMDDRINIMQNGLIQIFQKQDSRFNRIDETLNRIDGYIPKIDTNFETINSKFEEHDKNFQKIFQVQKKIESRFQQIEARFQGVEMSLKNIGTKLSQIEHNEDSFFAALI